MIIRDGEGVLVHGITGRQATFWTERMIAYGTRVVGGVNPNKAGSLHCGVPVYASAREVARVELIDAAVLFVPALGARDSALDAIESGIRRIVILAEHVPVHDVMYVLSAARANGAKVLGPNTAGTVTSGECFVGFMPAFDERIFRAGRIGVISRSGSLGTFICLKLVEAGYGQSAFVGIGGDPIVGTTMRDALAMLETDLRTEVVVLVGEIGGSQEEEAADIIATMRKPVVAFVAGRTAPPGRKMGHAGAIVEGDRGSHDSKCRALERAGARVLEVPSDVGTVVAELSNSPLQP